ncbi:MAG: hypothetical protein RJA79_1232, partial [Actinomycetota bacterium]
MTLCGLRLKAVDKRSCRDLCPRPYYGAPDQIYGDTFSDVISLVEAQEIVIGGCHKSEPVLADCHQMTGRVVAQDVVATEFI